MFIFSTAPPAPFKCYEERDFYFATCGIYRWYPKVCPICNGCPTNIQRGEKINEHSLPQAVSFFSPVCFLLLYRVTKQRQRALLSVTAPLSLRRAGRSHCSLTSTPFLASLVLAGCVLLLRAFHTLSLTI